MSGPLTSAALLCTALGVSCGALVLARSRQVRPALAVLVEFLLAAGLLRLSQQATWRALAMTAVIVGIRKLVVDVGLRLHPALQAPRRGPAGG